jgi:hypothetical protein
LRGFEERPMGVAMQGFVLGLSNYLASTTGIKVSPRFTGGEVDRIIDHGAYRTVIHRPVFDGLIGKRQDGFIQIEWQPITALPPVIEEKIDFTGDGKGDFTCRLDDNAGKCELTAKAPSVIAVQTLVRVKGGWLARFQLRKAP